MSKLFYDHIVKLEELEKIIKSNATSIEEKEELWHLIDEIVHHRVLGCLLDNLDDAHHEEFIDLYHQIPHHEDIEIFLVSRVGGHYEKIIEKELQDLSSEIIAEVFGN